MMEKLYQYCCRLCLHDGSDHQLLDILSVKGLKDNIANIFNIEIATQDACSTNICLNCFNETLTMEKQFQLYEEQKRTILANQLRLQENPAEATSELASAANGTNSTSATDDAAGKKSSDQPRDSCEAPHVAKNNINSTEEQSRKTKHNSKDASGKILKETKKNQNKSKNHSTKDKNKKVVSSHNAPDKTKQPSEESVQKKPLAGKVIIATNKQQQIRSEAVNTNECTIATNSEKASKSKPKKSVTGILKGRQKTQKNDTPVSNSSSNINNTSGHNGAEVNNSKPNNTNSVVFSTSTAVRSTHESNTLNVVNIQRQEAQASNNEPPSFVIQKVSFLGATVSKATTTIASTAPNNTGGMVWFNNPVNQPVTVQSNYETHAGQKKGQSGPPPLAVYTIPSIAAQKNPTSSVPPHNVVTTVASSINSDAILTTVTTSANQVGRCGVTTLLPQNVSQTKSKANHSSVVTYSNAPSVSLMASENNATTTASANHATLVHANNINVVADQQPSSQETSREGGTNAANSNTSPAALTKKRRHSTYIRVSSNLFDEPPERAQFAMLNNNLLLRNFESQWNGPPTAQIVRLPVLPPGLRVQAIPNPAILPGSAQTAHTSMNNNYTWQNNVNNAQYLHHIAAAGSNQTQASSTCTDIVNTPEAVSGARTMTTTVSSGTIIQQQFSGSRLIQQGRVVPNNSHFNQLSVPNVNHSGGILDSARSIQNSSSIMNNSNDINATLSSGQVAQQPIRPCFRCNICNTYYLIEHNLQAHMQRVHQMEKTEQTCSKIYDSNILNKLLTRFRRKSIADPLTLSNNRAHLN